MGGAHVCVPVAWWKLWPRLLAARGELPYHRSPAAPGRAHQAVRAGARGAARGWGAGACCAPAPSPRAWTPAACSPRWRRAGPRCAWRVETALLPFTLPASQAALHRPRRRRLAGVPAPHQAPRSQRAAHRPPPCPSPTTQLAMCRAKTAAHADQSVVARAPRRYTEGHPGESWRGQLADVMRAVEQHGRCRRCTGRRWATCRPRRASSTAGCIALRLVVVQNTCGASSLLSHTWPGPRV